jgi:hypothetical protein
MFLRKLLDEEIIQIKKSKESANKTIKQQRKKLTEEIKLHQRTSHSTKVALLIKQLDQLDLISGLPVNIKVEDKFLCMNYDLLKKLERSLDKSNLRWTWIKIEGNSLIIRYQNQINNGTMELYGLPAHQVDLLEGLPTMDLKA